MLTDNYDVTRVLIFKHTISRTRFALVFGFSFRFPEDTLGMVKVFELDSDLPDWLHNWEPEDDFLEFSFGNIRWSGDDFENGSDTVFCLRRKGILKEIRAKLRKVPFFVSNVRILTDPTASGGLDEDPIGSW